MRTTLDIADDVLSAARDLARQQNRSIGEVISDFARQSIALQADLQEVSSTDASNAEASNAEASNAEASNAEASMEISGRLAIYGIRPLPTRGGIVNNEMIDRIRREKGI